MCLSAEESLCQVLGHRSETEVLQFTVSYQLYSHEHLLCVYLMKSRGFMPSVLWGVFVTCTIHCSFVVRGTALFIS